MKGKALIPLALGLGMGLLAIKYGLDTVRKAKGASADPTRKVLRAKQDIDPTVELTAEMLEFGTTSDKPSATDTDFSDIKSLVGRVTAKAIPQGVPVFKSMLAEPGTPPGVPGRIAPGYRAVSVEIDEVSGVAFNVRPGDWVDVIVVMDVEYGGSRNKETIAEVVLQRVEVASVGLGSGGAAKGTSGSKTRTARSATLLVPESDVTKLHLAATRGKVTLAMRGDDDERVSDESFAARSSEILRGLKSMADGSTDAGAPKGPDGGILSTIAGMMKSAPATSVDTSGGEAPASAGPETPSHGQPFSMVVSHGGTLPGSRSQAVRITYESPDSNTVLSVTQGPQVGGGSLLKARSDSLPAGLDARSRKIQPPSGGSDISEPPASPEDEDFDQEDAARPRVGE